MSKAERVALFFFCYKAAKRRGSQGYCFWAQWDTHKRCPPSSMHVDASGRNNCSTIPPELSSPEWMRMRMLSGRMSIYRNWIFFPFSFILFGSSLASYSFFLINRLFTHTQTQPKRWYYIFILGGEEKDEVAKRTAELFFPLRGQKMRGEKWMLI